jgi:transposase-like protein
LSESLAAHDVAGRLDTMTTRRRHSPEQVVRKLEQAHRMLTEGKNIADVWRELQAREQTYCRWRNQFAGWRPKTPSG